MVQTGPARVWPTSGGVQALAWGSHGDHPPHVARKFDLHSIASTRQLEGDWAARLPAHTLMQRAGLSVARLALALHPHAQTIWIACGPGNNGGDGLEAASHLHLWGKTVFATWLGTPERCSADTLASYQRAREAGVAIHPEPPSQYDLAIDALLGIGAAIRQTEASHSSTATPAPSTGSEIQPSHLRQWVDTLNRNTAPILSIDLPSGLHADTGAASTHTVHASATLSLLTLKPGLFTGQGRDYCGEIWLDAIGCENSTERANSDPLASPAAQLVVAASPRTMAPHTSHKGSFGDVVVAGGAPGMTGAALLAATAALHAGAGRVLVALLDGSMVGFDPGQPELMFRPIATIDVQRAALVCGCGGGDVVRHHLAKLLSTARAAVLDADALNAIAADVNLQTLLARRAAKNLPTVLTPHPLEAARLLGCTTAEVQAHRLHAAQRLAERFACIVVLKGSGSVVAAPAQVPLVNASGNARLACAGTGDVLAGMIGATLARLSISGSWGGEAASRALVDAVSNTVFQHGWAANQWPAGSRLTASALAKAGI